MSESADPQHSTPPDTPESSQLDQAYREVLERMDEVEWELQSALADAAAALNEDDDPQQDERDDPSAAASTESSTQSTTEFSPQTTTGAEHTAAIDDSDPTGENDSASPLEEAAAELLAEPLSELSAQSEPDERIQPAQIIEAALFVGGQPLTSKRLCTLLRREFDQEYVERRISQLNERYAQQLRPYSIVFGEGGYRLELLSAFEAVRNRVFGLGPREVKLSHEALEILSLIAYRQPLSKPEIDAAAQRSSDHLLRQLLRRDLVSLERGEKRTDVRYRTTARFLSLFGLKQLDELPVADDLSFR